MKYKITLIESAALSLSRFSPSVKSRIREGLDLLSLDPHCGQPLKNELEGLWRYRVATYRIVYRIHSHQIEVVVIAIGPRSNIYNNLCDNL